MFVINGYLNEELFNDFFEVIDAVNIDVKVFNDEFYKKVCSGDLEMVKRFVEICVKKIYIEIIIFIILMLNDRDEEIESFVKWIVLIDDRILLYFIRYFLRYKMIFLLILKEMLMRLREVVKKYFVNVYFGNI